MRTSALAPERIYRRKRHIRILRKRPAFFIDGRRIHASSITMEWGVRWPDVSINALSYKPRPFIYTISWADNNGLADSVQAQLERSVHRISGRMMSMFTTQIDKPVTCILETVSEV